MQKIHLLFFRCFFSTFLIFLALSGSVRAGIFNLSYSLTEGGIRLELNSATPYRGVQIRVDSDVSTRYEVMQKIVTPFQKRDNPGIALGDNFVFRGLRGTNQFGDFRVPSGDSSVRSDLLLYVSDASGHADSFTLAYGIRNIEEIEPGNYFGRIAFLLNPVSSAQQPVTQILDIYINIGQEGPQKAKIEISTPQGSKRIVLNPGNPQTKTADVLVKINGNFNRPFSIAEFLVQPLLSQESSKLDTSLLNFTVKEAKIGIAHAQGAPLISGMQNIYSSAPNGRADKYFVISYNLADLTGQKAGRYTSRIQYLLEQAGSQTMLDALDLEIENDRIFDLQVTPLDQKYSIEFTNVRPTEPPRTSHVKLEIFSNIGKQYQVSQEVYSDLTNKDGNTIASKYFTMRTESIDSIKGKLKYPQPQEVKKGSSVLFISDSQGSGDKFKITYQLESPKDIKAGDYSTRITYTLSEI